MKGKRIFCGLLAAVFSLGTIAGCTAKTGGKEGGTGGNTVGSVSGGNAKVEFWNDKLANTDQTDIDSLMESISGLSGIQVSCVPYPDVAAYQTALQQSIGTEDAPELFTWWSGPQLSSLAESGNLEDLTDIWNEYVVPNGVSDDVRSSLSYDGKIYAVPYSIIYNTLIYNKKIFDKYHLKTPENFDEFLSVCDVLKSNGVTPIALKNDSWAGFIWFQAMLAAFDPELYQGVCDGSIPYTDERVKKVMGIWQEMIDKGYFSDPMQITDMDKSLANGTVAMELEPNYECVALAKNYGMEPGKDMGTFVLPSMSGGKKAIFYEIAPMCISAKSDQKEAAKEVLKSWYKKEHQTVFTNVTGFLCTTEVTSDNECSNEMVAYTKDTEHYMMLLRYYENTDSAVRDIALDELMKFETKAAGADEVLTAIQKKADEIFKR